MPHEPRRDATSPSATAVRSASPVPELEARVVNPETLADCGAGELGELWFRGPLLMEGYYGRERHEVFTARRLVPHR